MNIIKKKFCANKLYKEMWYMDEQLGQELSFLEFDSPFHLHDFIY